MTYIRRHGCSTLPCLCFALSKGFYFVSIGGESQTDHYQMSTQEQMKGRCQRPRGGLATAWLYSSQDCWCL